MDGNHKGHYLKDLRQMVLRYDLSVSYEYKINKKEHIIINGMDDYLKKIKNSDNQSEECLQEGKDNKNNKKDQDFIEKLEKMNFHVPIDKKKKIKKANMFLWISEDFPLKFPVKWFLIYFGII